MADPSFQDDMRFRILRALQANPTLTHKQLAQTLGVSAGSVNYCLRALIGKGMVKAEAFRASKNRLAYLYLLTPSGMIEKAALTRRFLRRKLAEYDALQAEIAAVTAELATDQHLRDEPEPDEALARSIGRLA